jgi:hypothetical protein
MPVIEPLKITACRLGPAAIIWFVVMELTPVPTGSTDWRSSGIAVVLKTAEGVHAPDRLSHLFAAVRPLCVKFQVANES